MNISDFTPAEIEKISEFHDQFKANISFLILTDGSENPLKLKFLKWLHTNEYIANSTKTGLDRVVYSLNHLGKALDIKDEYQRVLSMKENKSVSVKTENISDKATLLLLAEQLPEIKKELEKYLEATETKKKELGREIRKIVQHCAIYFDSWAESYANPYDYGKDFKKSAESYRYSLADIRSHTKDSIGTTDSEMMDQFIELSEQVLNLRNFLYQKLLYIVDNRNFIRESEILKEFAKKELGILEPREYEKKLISDIVNKENHPFIRSYGTPHHIKIQSYMFRFNDLLTVYNRIDNDAKSLVELIQSKVRLYSLEEKQITTYFVNESRIEELRQISNKTWDTTKLVRLCEELNISYSKECFYSTGVLIRSIMDHIPPVFGQPNFKSVCSQSRNSIKKSLTKLEDALRNFADDYLHSPIDSSHSLPNQTQVSFSQELDLLLGEVYSKLKK